MSKIKYLLFLLFTIFLTACKSPNISNLKSSIVENNPGNYQKVTKTTVYISTEKKTKS